MFERFKRNVQKGSPRDRSRILSAEFQNQLTREHNAYHQSGSNTDHSMRAGQVHLGNSPTEYDPDIVVLRNDLYHNLRKFDVVTFGPIEADPNENYSSESYLYAQNPVYRALPQVPDRQGRMAVVVEDISRCSYGRAVVSGVTWANGSAHRGTHVGVGPGEMTKGAYPASTVSISASDHHNAISTYSLIQAKQIVEGFVLDSINQGLPDPSVSCNGRCVYECKNSEWSVVGESCNGDCRCQVGPGTEISGQCDDGDVLSGEYCASWPKRLSHIRIGQFQYGQSDQHEYGGTGVDKNGVLWGLCEYSCDGSSWSLASDPGITAPWTNGAGEYRGFECIPAGQIPLTLFPCNGSTSGCMSSLALPPVIKESGSKSDFDDNGHFYHTTSTTTVVPGTTSPPTTSTTQDPSCQTRSCLYSVASGEPALLWDHCRSWKGPDYRCYCDMGSPDSSGNWQFAGEEVFGGHHPLLQSIRKSPCTAASCDGGCWWKPTVDGWAMIGANPCSPWCECPEPDDPAPLYADDYAFGGVSRVDGGMLFYTECGAQACISCDSGLCKWVSDAQSGSWSLEASTCSDECVCNPNPPILPYIFDVNQPEGSRRFSATFYRKCCSNSLSSTTTSSPSTSTASPSSGYSDSCMGDCRYICGPGGWRVISFGCFPSSCQCPVNPAECTPDNYGITSTVSCGSTTTSTTSTTTSTTTEEPTTSSTTTTTTTTTSTTTPDPSSTSTTTTTSTTPDPSSTSTTTTSTTPEPSSTSSTTTTSTTPDPSSTSSTTTTSTTPEPSSTSTTTTSTTPDPSSSPEPTTTTSTTPDPSSSPEPTTTTTTLDPSSSPPP